MKALIVNADDFGLTPGVNRGIVELYQKGVVTSTSLMATAPAAEDAVELASAHPGLGVGCHVNFVEGLPVSHALEIPTLLGADGKTFRPSMADFTQAVLLGKVEQVEIARETQAQIQRLQRAGIDVTHVDTHKHTHLFPLVARTIVHIAQRCGVHAVRNPYEPSWAARKASASLMRKGLLALSRLSEDSFLKLPEIAGREMLTTDGTLGIAGTGVMTAAMIRATLQAMPKEGLYEWCCHPGFQDRALDASPTRLRATREDEMAMLLEVIPEMVRSVDGLELVHYGNLGVAGLQRACGQFEQNSGFEKVI